MAVNSNWPLVVDQVAFVGDPNDPNSVASYTDITARVRTFESARGRQYEIDQNQTGEAHLTVSDKDEYLNPANTSAPAPYAGNIKPYRRYLRQAMWPPAPITSADRIVYRQTTSAVNNPGASSSFAVPAPADLMVGDTMLIAVGIAGSTTVTSAPAGWTLIAGPTVKGTVLTTYVYQRAAAASDVGSSFTFGLSAADQYSAVCVALAGYSGAVRTQLSVAAAAQAAEGSTAVVAHTAGSVTTTQAQSALIGVWARATISGTWVAAPAGDTQLAQVIGTDSGSNDVALMISASPMVAAGTYSKTANTDVAATNCTMGLVAVSVIPAVNLLNIVSGYDPSFESYALGTTPPNVLSFNTAPLVQVDVAWSGTKVLEWGVTGNSTEQIAGLTIPCIPGRPYVASAYMRQTAANTTLAFIESGNQGASTTTTGSYVRLSVAFVASQPTHRFWVGSFTPTLSSVVSIDAIQLEQVSPLNANPTFETGLANWTPHGGTATLSAAWQQQGQYSMLLTPDGVSAQCYATSEEIPVTAGAPYLVGGWAYSPTGVPGAAFSFTVNWYDASHGFLSASATGLTLTAGTITERDDQVTAPAGAAYARVTPTIGGTPPASRQVYVDNVALCSATPSAFATSGPTIYAPFAGYIERWPASWNHQGTYGMCALACVDAMATLAGTDLHAEYRGAVLAKKPDYYWPLGESSTATTFGDASGNSGPSLNQDVSKYGAGTAPAGGTTMNIAGDPGGTGVKFTPASPTSGFQAATILGAGPLVGGSPPLLLPATIGTSWAITASAWVQVSSSTETSQVALRASTPIAASASGVSAFVPIQLDLQNAANTIAFQNVAAGTNYIATQGSSVTIADGKLHHVVGVVAQDSTNTTLTVYVDGTATGTKTVSTSSVGGMLAAQSTNLFVGGYDDSSWFEFITNGSMAHLAMWNRALSSSEIADLWNAGKGYAGETSGQRIARLLSIGGYTGPTAIDTGQSVMGASTITEGAALLDACQQVTLSENGNFYVEAGTVTAKSRTDRYLKLTSTWTFGENAAGGEYPYEADIAYDFDPTRVANDVKVSRTGGITATASDPNVSQKQYFRRSYQRTIGVQSDLETIDAANYLLNKGKQPIQRISRLSIRPSANPALWPAALGVRIGDRVTVKRRTAAGLTMTNDYFVEKVEHQNEPGSWVTSLQMSPVDASTVWILGDATYGQLGISSILGY